MDIIYQELHVFHVHHKLYNVQVLLFSNNVLIYSIQLQSLEIKLPVLLAQLQETSKIVIMLHSQLPVIVDIILFWEYVLDVQQMQ